MEEKLTFLFFFFSSAIHVWASFILLGYPAVDYRKHGRSKIVFPQFLDFFFLHLLLPIIWKIFSYILVNVLAESSSLSQRPILLLELNPAPDSGL